jgi:hypothetical protein
MSIAIGTPKYDKKTKNYFSFKKGQDTFILRILPPLGNLAASGKWSVFHRVEYGAVGTDGKLKPYLSPRVVNYNGMVEVESASHLRREALKAQQEQAKKQGNTELFAKIKLLLEKYNQDAKHYMNAIDLNGNVGLFKIGHRGFESLKAAIERLRAEGVDPISVDNGRFFVFSRSGSGRDTIYTVVEYKQKMEIEQNGQKFVVDRSVPHALTESILGKLESDAFDLSNVYPSITAEEESRIVNEGATAVDEILGKGGKKTANSTLSQSSSLSSQSQSMVSEQQMSTKTLPDNANVNLRAELQQMTAGLKSSAPEEQVQSSTNLADLNEEDLLKQIALGNF